MVAEMVGLLKFLEWGFKDRCWIAIVLTACCLALGTAAIAGSDDRAGHSVSVRWNLPVLMQAFAQVKSDNPHFVQRQYLHALTKPLVSSGVLVYKAPDYLEQRTELPSPQRAIIRGDLLTLYSPAWHGPRHLSLRNTPGIWAVVESLRATLSGHLPILQRYFIVQMQGSARGWRLEFKPKVRSLQTQLGSILISGSDARIDRIEIHYTQGNYSIMRLQRNTP
jgi:hypothetical protein